MTLRESVENFLIYKLGENASIEDKILLLERVTNGYPKMSLSSATFNYKDNVAEIDDAINELVFSHRPFRGEFKTYQIKLIMQDEPILQRAYNVAILRTELKMLEELKQEANI